MRELGDRDEEDEVEEELEPRGAPLLPLVRERPQPWWHEPERAFGHRLRLLRSDARRRSAYEGQNVATSILSRRPCPAVLLRRDLRATERRALGRFRRSARARGDSTSGDCRPRRAPVGAASRAPTGDIRRLTHRSASEKLADPSQALPLLTCERDRMSVSPQARRGHVRHRRSGSPGRWTSGRQTSLTQSTCAPCLKTKTPSLYRQRLIIRVQPEISQTTPPRDCPRSAWHAGSGQREETRLGKPRLLPGSRERAAGADAPAARINPFPGLVRPGRPTAHKRGEQAEYECQRDKAKPHSEPSFLVGRSGRPDC